jgi:hypothetical protein
MAAQIYPVGAAYHAHRQRKSGVGFHVTNAN